MSQLTNCPVCGALYVENVFRKVCESCYKKEERLFQAVHEFIRKRENRTATMIQVVKATGVDESLIHKFIKQGRLQIAHFPNLGYPCNRCGNLIREGKMCAECRNELQKELSSIQEMEQRQQHQRQPEGTATYHVTRREF